MAGEPKKKHKKPKLVAFFLEVGIFTAVGRTKLSALLLESSFVRHLEGLKHLQRKGRNCDIDYTFSVRLYYLSVCKISDAVSTSQPLKTVGCI
jgi:hypothetical protein